MIAAYNLVSWLEARGFAVAALPKGLSIKPGSSLPPELKPSISRHLSEMRDVLEIRALLEALGCPKGHPDHSLAMELAVRDPDHLEGLRASARAEGLM